MSWRLDRELPQIHRGRPDRPGERRRGSRRHGDRRDPVRPVSYGGRSRGGARRHRAGSNRSTAKEAMHELAAAEAKRAALIGQIDLRLVSDRDGRQ